MPTQHLAEGLTALFILLMIWLRTRMYYKQRGAGPLQLEPPGRAYFAAAIAMIILGWLLAPAAGRALWPSAAVTPTVPRVAWFLGSYYLFILVHRILRSRGAELYSSRQPPPSAL